MHWVRGGVLKNHPNSRMWGWPTYLLKTAPRTHIMTAPMCGTWTARRPCETATTWQTTPVCTGLKSRNKTLKRKFFAHFIDVSWLEENCSNVKLVFASLIAPSQLQLALDYHADSCTCLMKLQCYHFQRKKRAESSIFSSDRFKSLVALLTRNPVQVFVGHTLNYGRQVLWKNCYRSHHWSVKHDHIYWDNLCNKQNLHP